HRHEPGTRLVPADDCLERAVVKRIEERQIAFPRHAIGARDAVSFEAPDDEIGDAHQGNSERGELADQARSIGIGLPGPAHKVEPGLQMKNAATLLRHSHPLEKLFEVYFCIQLCRPLIDWLASGMPEACACR